MAGQNVSHAWSSCHRNTSQTIREDSIFGTQCLTFQKPPWFTVILHAVAKFLIWKVWNLNFLKLLAFFHTLRKDKSIFNDSLQEGACLSMPDILGGVMCHLHVSATFKLTLSWHTPHSYQQRGLHTQIPEAITLMVTVNLVRVVLPFWHYSLLQQHSLHARRWSSHAWGSYTETSTSHWTTWANTDKSNLRIQYISNHTHTQKCVHIHTTAHTGCTYIRTHTGWTCAYIFLARVQIVLCLSNSVLIHEVVQ